MTDEKRKGKLSSFPASLTAGKVPNFWTCSLDRVSFVADFMRRKVIHEKVPGPGGKPTTIKQDVTLHYWSSDVGLLEKFPAKFPYRWNFKHLLGYFVQYADKTSPVKPIRVDCNPSRYVGEQKKEFLNSLKNLVSNLTDQAFTRLDFCIDVDVDLSEWAIMTEQPKKSIRYVDRSGKLETLYLGTRESNVMYRIYDKAKEQGISGKTWWRIEVQYRFDSDFKFINIAPFEDLRIFKLDCIDDWKERIVMQQIIENPELFGQMKRSTRANYRRKLKYLASENLHSLLPDIFKRDSVGIVNQLNEILGGSHGLVFD